MSIEKEGRFLGTPQTPAGGLRPPAPPAQQLNEYKEWLLCTKLTILIVNLAVKREHGACCLSSSEWGIIYSTGHFFFATEEHYGRATQHYPCSTYSLGPRMVPDLSTISYSTCAYC